MNLVVSEASGDDDLLLGASASPTTGEFVSNTVLGFYIPMEQNAQPAQTSTAEPELETSSKYVGLVNQAMTCYLNSLIQALYMTPEFRNALYNWEFDGSEPEAKSIPFQLQKLFLNLQVSWKNAQLVEMHF